MKRTGRILLIVALVVISIASTIIYLETTDQKEESYMSSYNYDISIEADGPMDDVTLYLPLPVFENTSVVGEDMISRRFYNKAPEWNFSLVDTEHGTLLAITNSKITPSYQSLPIPIDEAEDIENEHAVTVESDEYSEETPVLRPITFSVTTMTNQSINTKYPVGNASVLFPKYNLSISEPPHGIPTPPHIEPEYYEYESKIFAQYNTSNHTGVYIRVKVTGTNEWWVGGWRFNTFKDTVSIRMKGPQDGWRTADGSMTNGDGVY